MSGGIQDVTDECERQLQWLEGGSWEPKDADKLREVLYRMQEEVRKRDWKEGVEQERIRNILKAPVEHGSLVMVQPHRNSALVAIVEARGDKAVVKCRGEYVDKSRREEAHYKLARELGLSDVVAPCISLPLSLTNPSHPTTIEDALVQSLIAHYQTEEESIPPVEYCSAEAFISCNPWGTKGLAATLANDKGFCDLQSAFLSTPLGRLYDDEHTLLLQSSPSDYDFIQLIERASQEHLEQLVLLNIITLQRDGTPVNVMLQELMCGGFKLMAIDNTRTFGGLEEDKLEISVEEDDSRHASYWYPCSLGMPGAVKQVSEAMRARVAGWDPAAVEAFLLRHLTYNNMPDRVAAAKCAKRVAAIQNILKEDPTITLKQLAFKVVPSWEADWDLICEEGEMGPLPDLQELAEQGEPLSLWVEDERAYNKKVMLKKVGKAVGLVGLLAAGGWCLSKYIRR